MKRHSLFLLMLFFACVLQAKEVSVQQAREMAVEYVGSHSSTRYQVRDIRQFGSDHGRYYIVNLAPSGWVIVSGDDVVKPIIGYSLTGSLEISRLPESMKYMLDCCGQEIERSALSVTEQHPYWRTAGRRTLTRSSQYIIEPLIAVKWNQMAPYNAYCPKRGDTYALVGCVAVAMGQAMSVQRYPARARGEISYTASNYGGLRMDFSTERAYNWDDILSGANNYDEVARLLYHAGLSVRMDYGEDGSGIPSNEVNRISNALKNTFSYPEEVEYIWRDYYEGDWEQLLVNELSAGRAVIYNAIDTKNKAGHSFNVDGYDGDGHFHVNWGWGGYGDAYFSVNGLRDSYQGYDFDASHVAVIGIGGVDQVLKSISLSNTHIEEGLPAGSVVGQVLVNGEMPLPDYAFSVSGVSGKDVPFKIENGLLKTTAVLQVSASSRWDLDITVQDNESGAELTQGFRVYVDSWQSLEKTTSLSFDRESRLFRLVTKHNVSYRLVNEQGTVLQSGMLEPLPQLEIPASLLSPGRNTLTLECVDDTKSIQLINNK